MQVASVSVLFVLLTCVVNGNIYDRPFHLTYANVGGKQLLESDAEILSAFANMPMRPTMALQVILNKADITTGDGSMVLFVREFQKLVPNMCFGVGKGKVKYNISRDWDWFMDRAIHWRNFTDCISIEAFDVLVENAPESKMIEFLTALRDMGYAHIVSNPWKRSESGTPWPFVDAAWIGIGHLNTSKYVAFHPRLNRAATIHENSPDVRVLMNYENAPGHIALALLGKEGSCDTMQIAVDSQIENADEIAFSWAPPWTSNYDPLQIGSWDWIQDTYATLYANTVNNAGAAAVMDASAVSADDNAANVIFRTESEKFTYLVAIVSFCSGSVFVLVLVCLVMNYLGIRFKQIEYQYVDKTDDMNCGEVQENSSDITQIL